LAGSSGAARDGTTNGRTIATLLALATLYTALNAAKPLHVDDPFTYYVARQIAASPADPFGADIYWYQWPQPIHEDLLAPVIAYWGALGLAVADAGSVAWKLWLLPFACLFAAGLHALARRMAPGLELWIVAATLFGPAFLPSFNYMQDVPALALGTSALALYLRADGRASLAGAVVAGLVAGLAMQTKWTQFTIPAAIALHGILSRRLVLPVAAIGAAALVFAGWEAYMTSLYGHGMFLFQLGFPFFWTPRLEMVAPLVRLLGALLPAVALLALAASGVASRAVLALGAALLGAWALLLARPIQNELFLGSGLLAIGAAALAALRSLAPRARDAAWSDWIAAHCIELFLIGWALGEVATYFLISYFPAVRRVLAITLVATLLVGRFAARARRPLPLAPLLALQLALGLAVWSVDWLEARAQRDAAAQALAAVRARDPGGAVWYTGHWGFQFYAEALGMRPLVPDHTTLRRGEWLVVPAGIDQQEAVIAREDFERVATIRIPPRVPLASLRGFYVGSTPLEHHRGPRLRADVYRARRDVVPASAWSLARIAEWALHAGGGQAQWAAPALARALEAGGAPGDRALAAEALAALARQGGRDAQAALERAAASADPALRDAAQRALAGERAPAP
jgi:hypothetical protein